MNAFDMPGTFPDLPHPELEREFYRGVPLRRLVAWFIDLAIVLLVGVPLALVFGLLTLGFGFAIFPMIVMGVGFFYRTATLAEGSATWGMRFTGIELRRNDGSRLDFLTALLHVSIYTVSIGTVFLQALSCLGIALTRYNQGVPDLILRTVAINRPAD